MSGSSGGVKADKYDSMAAGGTFSKGTGRANATTNAEAVSAKSG
jgi:hypothetical protein